MESLDSLEHNVELLDENTSHIPNAFPTNIIESSITCHVKFNHSLYIYKV